LSHGSREVPATTSRSTETRRRGPLAGVRIVDLTRLGYGAQATAICGCLGAEVLRVESRTRPDPIRVMPPFVPAPGEARDTAGVTAGARLDRGFDRGAIFFKYNPGGKRSVALNLKDPRGMDVLRRLVATADVLAESFSAGALARMGLPWEALRALRPDLVYVSMAGLGHRGRDAAHVTLGPTAQALTGLTYMLGVPGRRPAGWSFSYLDHMGGYLGACAILIALRHRRRTGEGQHVDVSQLDPGVPLAGPAALDRQVNGRTYRRPDTPPGNRSPEPPMAPHGVYPCRGAGEWIAIACRDDADWRRLRAAMGEPAWARDARFETVAGRRAHEDDLDGALGAWTLTRERYALADLLAAAGVAAAPVQDARDRVERDPQLRAREYLVPLPHGAVGTWPLERLPFRLSRSDVHPGGTIRRGPPCLGEDTAAVLREVLAMPEREIAALAAAGVLA
jgi:crotonobetainyl-CoA:carnitine CoA-transferase CaiB-like acyl-CoA transferase